MGYKPGELIQVEGHKFRRYVVIRDDGGSYVEAYRFIDLDKSPILIPRYVTSLAKSQYKPGE